MPPADSTLPVRDGDELYVEAIDTTAAQAHTRFDRFVLRVTGWFARHTIIRLIVALTGLTFAILPGILLLIFRDATDKLEGLGYASVFLMNLASTATVFFPVPGLTAAAQALIATEGENARLPWLVGIAGGLGMAIGEITAYYGGYLGAEMVRGRELPGPKRFHAMLGRVLHAIGWLINRWGVPTLFVLSAIPNPFFEVAGLTAGSVRMPFRQFLVAVTGGKIVRGILIAYYGADLWDGVTSILPFG
jgi:membrane protein DedA with SNARE-associated domain